jgi:hypothetical protein
MSNDSSMSLNSLKDIIFQSELSRFPYLNNFYSNPYTYLKARYYMYGSILLVYVLLRTRITPNAVTIAYGLSGIVGGVFLAIPNIYCIYIGAFIFFNKSILDWSDGHLARIKYHPSLTGHILDEYGARINSISFTIGLGFFVFNQLSDFFIIYMIVLISFFHGEKFTSFGSNVILNDLQNLMKNSERVEINSDNKKEQNVSNDYAIKPKYPNFVKKIATIFDDRARSVDFILLIVISDYYTNLNLSLYIFVYIFFKLMAQFILSTIVGVRTKWAESILDNIKCNVKW